VASVNPDLIILDIMLPTSTASTSAVNQREKQSPDLMLSARREDVDKIVGLELGADDICQAIQSVRAGGQGESYITPLTAEVEPPQTIDVYGIHIDILKREVVIKNEQLKLAPKSSTCCLFLRRIRTSY